MALRQERINDVKQAIAQYEIAAAELEAAVAKTNELRNTEPRNWFHYPDPRNGSMESANLRRKSMDLTRALAQLRKP